MSDGVRHEIGRQIEQRRVQLGKTRQDLERDAGIAAGVVGRAESGQRGPRVETLMALAKALNCHFDVGGEHVKLRPNEKG